MNMPYRTLSLILSSGLLSLSALAQVQPLTSNSSSINSAKTKQKLQVAAVERKKLELSFDSGLSAERIGKNIKELSAKPHHLGSPGSKAVAENILAQFKQYGWDAQIETYQVLFPTPKTRVLEMTYPGVYQALLKEPALK